MYPLARAWLFAHCHLSATVSSLSLSRAFRAKVERDCSRLVAPERELRVRWVDRVCGTGRRLACRG